MSIKHIYEHLLEHFICLKSFIITVKFSCYALWAKSWSSFSLNSHWLQQQADLIVCGFPYQFNTALKKMGSLVSTMLDRKSQHLAALNIYWTFEPSNAIRTNKQIKTHAHRSVTSTLHYKTQLTLRLELQGMQVSHAQIAWWDVLPPATPSQTTHWCSCHQNLGVLKPSKATIQPHQHWSPPLTHPDSHSTLQQQIGWNKPCRARSCSWWSRVQGRCCRGNHARNSDCSEDVLYNCSSLTEFHHLTGDVWNTSVRLNVTIEKQHSSSELRERE